MHLDKTGLRQGQTRSRAPVGFGDALEKLVASAVAPSAMVWLVFERESVPPAAETPEGLGEGDHGQLRLKVKVNGSSHDRIEPDHDALDPDGFELRPDGHVLVDLVGNAV